MARRKIIFFELNEVPYRILDRFHARYPKSAIAKILTHGRQFETVAADSGPLFPTKTWPTVHRGVTCEQHGLTNFGQDLSEVDRAYPSLWQLLANHGVKVGVFGSFFTFPMPSKIDNYAFYMPDAFASDSTAYPESMQAFQRFNLRMSRASTRNVSRSVDMSSAMGLVPHLGKLGLTANTMLGIGSQLLLERRNPRMKTRRRSYQTVLGFDIFFRQLRTLKPEFCTFFTNHVAATMHRYWAATFPDDYERFGLDDEWVATYRNEIDFAMAQTDRLLGKLVAFVDRRPEYQLMIVTSMGQAALIAEPVTSCLSITNMRQFLSYFGLGAKDYEERPAMAPIFNVVVARPEKRRALSDAVKQLTIEGRRFGNEVYDGFFEFSFGHWQNYQGPETILLGETPLSFSQMGLGNMAHEDGVYLTADHVPEGAFIVYDPQKGAAKEERPRMSTLEIAPMVLRNFSISAPSYMS